MDETFINNLASALRKVGTIHTVGEEWHSITGEIPVGGVPYCGQEVTRETYYALWAYAQEKGLVKSEAEWQSLNSSQKGNVPFYSDGNGSSTFRMPKMVGYIKGASGQAESGSYVSEGLPNITGAWQGVSNLEGQGASGFEGAVTSGRYSTSANFGAISSGTGVENKKVFDASRSNSIYGNSSHVTPETSVVMFGVYAFGVVTNVGELDVSAIARDASDAKMGLEGVVRSINGLTADASGNVSIVIPPTYVLPTATSSVLGGVKTGSNITNSNGTISLSNSNVTSALGYTPVKSVNGTSADASGNVVLNGGGVTSLEGMTGDLMIWGTDSVGHSQSYTHSKYAEYTKTYTYTLPRSGKTTITASAHSYAKNSTNSLVVKVGNTTVYSKSQATPNTGSSLRYSDTLALQKDTVITVSARGKQNTDETHSSISVRIDYYDVRESFY